MKDLRNKDWHPDLYKPLKNEKKNKLRNVYAALVNLQIQLDGSRWDEESMFHVQGLMRSLLRQLISK